MTHRDDDLRTDELDALRAAFDALPVPDATPRLAESDEETRAAVAWMADAFAALPIPAVEVPTAATPAPILTPPRAWLRHAAAAAVFASLALALSWSRGAEQAERVAPVTPPVTADADLPPVREPIPGFREAAPGSSGLVAVTTDHLEVSSGSVRLVLLTTGSSWLGGPSLDLP